VNPISAIAQVTVSFSRRRQALFYALLLMAVAPLVPVRAKVPLPSIFSDGMILQTGAPAPIWGKASPGETVSVRFANPKNCKADSASRWSVKLNALFDSINPLQKGITMSPQAGWILQEEIVPRLRSAIPRNVNQIGSEDPEELIQDAKKGHSLTKAGCIFDKESDLFYGLFSPTAFSSQPQP
jgi:hypothetical protein